MKIAFKRVTATIVGVSFLVRFFLSVSRFVVMIYPSFVFIPNDSLYSTIISKQHSNNNNHCLNQYS